MYNKLCVVIKLGYVRVLNQITEYTRPDLRTVGLLKPSRIFSYIHDRSETGNLVRLEVRILV